MDSTYAPALFVPEGNEDSVDIYEGLDFDSSCKNVTPVKSAPSGLKESMDLFEEIVTEEQQSKEASYSELKSRFQAAQSQITELHRRLEQLELQNTGLSKENYRLKMNISILLQTARQEVIRKDAEIQRLNLQSRKVPYLQSRNLRDPGCSTENQRLAPPPLVLPSSSTSQPAPRPRLLPSKQTATPPPPLSAQTAASESPHSKDVTSRNRPPSNTAAPLLPPLKQTPNLPDVPPLPPTPLSPPPPPPPLPILPLGEDVRRDREKHIEPGLNSEQFLSRKDCHTSERHSNQTDKHKDKKPGHDFERKNNTSSNSGTDRHERRYSHKDQTTNSGDSKSGNKKSNLLTSESDRGKGHVSKGSQSRDERRDRTRDRPSRCSDSKEHKRHRDYSRTERRPSKDQQSRERRQERREEDDGRRRRRDSHSKEKHRSKEHSKKQSKPLEMSSKGKTVAEQVVVEENSPHRKLCFMETLNLTLSPVKKPEIDGESGQKVLVAAIKTQVEESLCLPNMEDMCIIDEVDSSETEAASREHVEPSDKDPKTTPDKGENVESHKETIVNSISTNSENEILEDNSVHSTSTSKGTEIQKNSSPKCIKDPMTEKSQDAVKEATTTENVISFIPTEAVESNNISNATNKTTESKCDVQSVSPDLPENTPLASSPDTQSKGVSSQETTSKEVELVSSSLSLHSLPQEGLSLPEAINLLTENNENSSRTINPESTTTSCSELSKVSSTTQDTSALERYTEISQTPKKSFSPAKFFSPAKSVEKCIKPSSSVPLFHDEDSMMRTLSSLKRIPDAISPLRSPIRISKRNQHHLQKPGHVKSLHKEFFSAPPDGISKKVDVNKENKQPGSPAKADPVALAVPSDPELEEGEILSESDEAASPLPPTKRTKLTRPIRIKTSPKCVLKRKMDEKSISAKEAKESPGPVQSPTNKSRFKTVCPAATKATFCSIEEVMDTFKLVRAEIRKKYMKLHKTFPKKSFYGVMENFQESFIEFVDGADFGQICNLTKELKSKLKKIIVSVFSKVLNNGIVKRIFEQQAVDLKQKLWDFVDVQVDYLFKDVNTALKSMCKPARSPVEHGNSKGSDKRCKESPIKRKEQKSPPGFSKNKPCAIVPFRTGLGSRGKGIRITLDHSDDNDDQSGTEPGAVVRFVPPTPEKGNTSLVVAHNTSMLDKTDFELLTEQQATSLTFNLVRDSQMGEIFKCLLQGSDLLDSSASVGDQSTWTLSTPRKDGERIITITTPGKFHSPSKLLSPSKFESPSRLITTWSSISPHKIPSPNSKVLLNPALFDESCLLEVPSENKTIQRPYSILAEDLAVSLTIPSPLKSDSHLSFLQPPPMQVLSTPDSVLSAHISEDALLDEADATEHDIHLTLDTDNSSCGSSASVGSQGAPTQFLFKPELPMQALVMERSNDHFILKIRPASNANTTLTANESLSETLTEEMDCEEPESNSVISSETQNNTVESIHTQIEDNNKLDEEQKQDLAKQDSTKHNLSDMKKKWNIAKAQPSLNHIHPTAKSIHKDKTGRDKSCLSDQAEDRSSEMPLSQVSSSHMSNSEREEVASESERSLTIAEELESTPEKSQVRKSRDRKRKRSQDKSKAKKCRTEEDSTQGVNLEGAGEEALSPNSLSAKNVIRRKGEVVMAWTREEDRTILLELKTKGASRETFAFLSAKLDKPSGQIAQRFHQLMKLFKKQEKLDT